MVSGYKLLRVAEQLVGSSSRKRQDGLPRIYDIRMRMRNGRHHSVKSHSKMVQRQGNGIGNGSRDGYRQTWSICSDVDIPYDCIQVR